MSASTLEIWKDHDGGPFKSVKEMDVGMKIVKDEQERKCCTMKSFSRKVCKKDCKENPYLYKVNSMTVV